MKHNLDRILRRVVLVALAPVVGDGVGEDVTRLVEGGGNDAAADVGVALETVLGVLVPEVEGAVGASGAEGSVDGVEGDVVYGMDSDDVVGWGVAVAFEGEVGSKKKEKKGLAFCERQTLSRGRDDDENEIGKTYELSLSSTY